MADAREEFAAELARLRAAAGLSFADLAAAAHCHRAYLHRLETGQRWPSRPVAAQLDAALDARRTLLAAWARGDAEHREEAEHRHLLAVSLRSSEQLDALLDPPAGQAADDALARADALGRAYLTTPPGPALRAALAARDATVTRLAGLHRAAPRRELTRAAGYLSGVLAYAALDLGNPGAAAAHAATAYRAGTATGDGALLAWTCGTQSLIARFEQDYATARDLARDGLAHSDGGTAGPRLLAGQAQSLANLGDRAGTHRALTAAETARERAGPDELGGLFEFSPAKLSYYGGSALIWLPEIDDARRGLAGATEAIALWEAGDPAAIPADDHALAHVYAATAAVHLADLDQAAAFLAPVFALPTERRISWLRKRVGRVGDLLAGLSGARAESLRADVAAFTA
ncbi:MAG: helix-turn-helix domain-containing protein [Pseudonocardiaceae bacterium]|nr:helix-turn-helix domain-containing protein [Pseudonocardiaceae bacterium]